MSEKILCTVKTWDGLAEAFADEVAKQYKSHLEFWQSTAMDDQKEHAMCADCRKLVPEMLRKIALANIKSIIENTPYPRKFYLKK